MRAGATIGQPLADHGYGLACTAHDLDGHPWFFPQAPGETGRWKNATHVSARSRLRRPRGVGHPSIVPRRL